MTKNIAKLLIIKLILLVSPISLIAHSVGIIPYIIQNQGGKRHVSFLFSKDKNRRNEWTDFSGSEEPKGKHKPDRNDAAREGYEETMGVFQGMGKMSNKWINPIKNEKNGIKKLVNEHLDKTKKIPGTHKIWGKPKNFNGEWLTYLIDVTKSVNIIGSKQKTILRLNNTLKTIKNNKYTGWKQYKNKALAYTEKKAFKWLNKDELLSAIKNRQSNFKLNGKLRQVLEKNIKTIKKLK